VVAKATCRSPQPGLSVSARHHMSVETTKEKIGIEVYADTIGPMQVHSIHGNRFAVHFTDAYSRFRWIKFVKQKSDIPECVIEFHKILLSLGISLQTFKSDGGGEFVNERLSDYANGRFTLRTSPPHCPQAMGLSERFNRILGEKTRALLKERKLERSLWEDAMKIIVYVQNRILNDDQLKTPFELMNGFKPNLSNLRIFGVPAFVYNFDPLRRKLDDKATEGIFIGYDDTSACYKIYSRKLRKVMKSIYVIFNESGEVIVDPNDLGQVEAYCVTSMWSLRWM
jgi:hypothetical protein